MTMRTAPMIGVDIHFGPDSITHKYHPADDKCHAYGVLKIDSGGATYANLYFDTDPAHVDAVIAELVALRAEMDPPVITGSERPVHRLTCGCTDRRCDCAGCRAGTPHEPGTPWHCDEHGETAVAEPAITDSERTCDQANPGSGAWCHRGGDHDEHRDTNGETWRTDGAVEPRSGCKCGHTGTVHFLDLLAGGDLTYCHLCDCIAYEYAPASVTA